MKPVLAIVAISILAPAAYAGEVQQTADRKAAKAIIVMPPEREPPFKIYGWLDSGITVNPAVSYGGQNFGRLFDDLSDEPVLNQAVITAERALNPLAATGFHWGFKAQFMFGTDARFIHSMGILDGVLTHSNYQFDLPKAYFSLHLPVLTEGGIDIKVGKFVTLEGAETIDPRPNVFYSHLRPRHQAASAQAACWARHSPRSALGYLVEQHSAV